MALPRPVWIACLFPVSYTHLDVYKRQVHIIVSDSESNLDAISAQAAAAHQQQWPYGATYYIADHSEHTLFDISDEPIDWSDPVWVQRYHRGAMQSMIDWMRNINEN